MFPRIRMESSTKLTFHFRLASLSAESHPWHSLSLVDFCSLVTMTLNARYVLIVLKSEMLS